MYTCKRRKENCRMIASLTSALLLLADSGYLRSANPKHAWDGAG